MRSGDPSLFLPFLTGGGQLGTLIAAFDWGRTPLGPIAGWAPHMKNATALMLRSRVPIVMLWGESGIMIYNDAYAVFAGSAIPRCSAPRSAKAGTRWPTSTTTS